MCDKGVSTSFNKLGVEPAFHACTALGSTGSTALSYAWFPGNQTTGIPPCDGHQLFLQKGGTPGDPMAFYNLGTTTSRAARRTAPGKGAIHPRKIMTLLDYD